MSCLSPSVSVCLQEQARVAFNRLDSRPRDTAGRSRAWFSRSLSFVVKKQWIKPVACAPPRRVQLRAQEDAFSENLFLELIKAILRDLYNVIMFLFEQPRELQYLEFPSLQSAGKMAIFTIAVVMVLIVFLATVDSAFSYIVASMFHRIK